MKRISRLAVEQLEERIAPYGGGTGDSMGNPGNEVSNGASPQPSGGGGSNGGGDGFGPSDNGNAGNEVSNGNSPQPSGR